MNHFFSENFCFQYDMVDVSHLTIDSTNVVPLLRRDEEMKLEIGGCCIQRERKRGRKRGRKRERVERSNHSDGDVIPFQLNGTSQARLFARDQAEFGAQFGNLKGLQGSQRQGE